MAQVRRLAYSEQAEYRRRRAIAFDHSARQEEALVDALLSVSFELAAIREALDRPTSLARCSVCGRPYPLSDGERRPREGSAFCSQKCRRRRAADNAKSYRERKKNRTTEEVRNGDV